MGALRLTSALLCVLLNTAVAEYTCEGAGYYPHPSDCSQFFRCTDIFANGQYQQYMFTCAEGTVFDASISVCNWPTLVPGCGGAAPTPGPQEVTTTSATPAVTTPDTEEEAVVTEGTVEEVEAGETGAVVTEVTVEAEVTYRPAENSAFECAKPEIVTDEDNCNKFWLCKEVPEGSGVLQSLLYRCPEGYLFNSSELRCRKEAEVTCIETPETRAVNIIQLTENMLASFFATYGG